MFFVFEFYFTITSNHFGHVNHSDPAYRFFYPAFIKFLIKIGQNLGNNE